MARLIAYLRVSTQRQGVSGLGLEAQRDAVIGYAKSAGHDIISEVREIESGRKCERPQLTRAISLCKLQKATLVVAKLDRLARDVQFLATLMNTGVEFVACDNPHANRLTLHILAAVAEDEATRISQRTKAALAAAKARGVQLGGSRSHIFSGEERARGAKSGGATRAQQAKERALALGPVLDELRGAGITTLQAMADALNERAIPTTCGRKWYPMTIANLTKKILEARQ